MMKESRLESAISVYFALLPMALSFFFVTVALGQTAGRDPETTILRFRQIKGWRGDFSYKLDSDFQGSFGNMTFSVSSGELSSETLERIEIEGEISFSGGSRGKFVGQGTASYQLQQFSLVKWGDKSILDTADGSGNAEILPEIEMNFLQFDLREGSYTLSISPGRYVEETDEYGVEASVVREMDIVDSFLQDMRNVDLEVPFSQILHAWFPDNLNQNGRVDIGVTVAGFPLPAFGNTLNGSFTDFRGGILSWELEPIEIEPEEFLVPVQITSASNTSLHFHPPSQDDRQGMRGLTYDAEMAERRESEPSSPEGFSHTEAKLFFIDLENSNQMPSTTGCNGRAVGVNHAFESLGSSGSDSQQETLMLKAAAHVLQEEGGSIQDVEDEGILGKTLFTLQETSPEDEGFPRLANELYGRNLVEGVKLDQATAVIELSEGFESFEPCVRERISVQLEKTAKQFSFVSSVKLIPILGEQ